MSKQHIAAVFFAISGCASAAEIPSPVDVDYPGTIRLAVDATDVAHRIFRIREEIPVRPGPQTLLYPQWLPGYHAPRGPIDKLAGLRFIVGGKPLAWSRDSTNVYAFHLDVPADATDLVAEFEFLSPQDPRQGQPVITTEMLSLEWTAVTLYPAGHFASRVQFAASAKLPATWDYATGLDVASSESVDHVIAFKRVSLETLIDSPLIARLHFKRVDLDPGAKVPIRLDMFADNAQYLDFKPEQIKPHVALVQQTYRLFGPGAFDHYDFLFVLSDPLSYLGIEHQSSSEDGADPGYFKDWDGEPNARDLLPHEFVHSWNGKFRRPAGLATPNYNVPMGDSLLWVYEGQTQYWAHVLAVRSGLWSAQQARDALALLVALYADNREGLSWRNVQDTTNDPVIVQRGPYRDHQLGLDYYYAGELIWLAVDTKLRVMSKERRSLDDFARTFFGVDQNTSTSKTYTFEDVVDGLNVIQPYDWKNFLRTLLESEPPPLDGLAASGWKLVYSDKPSDYQQAFERGMDDYGVSIGLLVSSSDGKIMDVGWNGPAFKAGITPFTTIVAVGNRAFTADRLRDAIARSKNGGPVELLIRDGDAFNTFRIDYHDGLKYPHLERVAGTTDRLDAILTPLRASVGIVRPVRRN